MKKLAYLFVALCLLIVSCKEKGPIINFTNVVSKDTSYIVTTVDTPQLRQVLIEEYTGVTCSNCPKGAQVVTGLEAQYPNRVNVMELHAGVQTTPLTISKYNFQTTAAAQIVASVAENPSKPAASIDQTTDNTGTYFVDRSTWVTAVNSRIGITSPLNIYVTSNYVAGENSSTIHVKVEYTQPVAKHQVLTLALIESKIIDPQEDGITIDTFYVHNHVLRDVITSVTGTPFLNTAATKVRGQVFETTLLYKLPTNVLSVDNCEIIAFVSDDEAGDRQVQQSVKVSVK